LAGTSEAEAAQDGAAILGLEGDCGVDAAIGAGDAHLNARTERTMGAFGVAGLAMPGVVLELLLVEEGLFASGEEEVDSAVDAGQSSIEKFQGRASNPGRGA